MALLFVIAIATLAANAATQLRHAAVALIAVSATANAIGASTTSAPQLAVALCAGAVAAGILFVAARDPSYGEDPQWRLWVATLVAAAVTPAAFFSFRTVGADAVAIPLFGTDPSGITVQVAGFWLIASGVAILVTARSAVRMSVGAFLMLAGVQLLVRLAGGPQLTLTLLLSWLHVVVALAGAFLIVNERALREDPLPAPR